MLRELLAASLLVLLVATGFAVAAPAVTPSMVSWRAQLPLENVSLGSPVQVLVYGPPNGTFNVTVSGAPPLSSVIFFDQNYTLPSAAANATLGASTIVSVPTGGLAYGPYSLAVYNESLGFEFSAFYVHLVPGVSSTYLVGQLLYLEELYNVTLLRQKSLAGQVAYYHSLVNDLFWVFIAEVVFTALAVTYVKTGDARSWWHRTVEGVKRSAHPLLWRAANSDPWDPMPTPNPVPRGDPERIWVNPEFKDCGDCLIPAKLEEQIDHAAVAHGVKREAALRMLQRSISAQKHLRDTMEGPLPSRKVVRKAIEQIDPAPYADIARGGGAP